MRFCLVVLSVFFLSQLSISSVQAQDEVFSSREKSLVRDLVSEFKVAMGSAVVDPANKCPGLREHLRAKIQEIQPLVELATNLPTDAFNNNNTAREILDTEEALVYVDKACSSSGV